MDSIKNGSNVITAALTGWDVTDVVVRRVSRQLTARLYRPINTKENLYSFLPSYWDSIFDDVTFIMVIRWANKPSPTLTIMINAMPLNNLHCIFCIILWTSSCRTVLSSFFTCAELIHKMQRFYLVMYMYISFFHSFTQNQYPLSFWRPLKENR